MDENHAEALWIISFEAFDHKLDRAIILLMRLVGSISSINSVNTMFAIEKSVMSNTTA